MLFKDIVVVGRNSSVANLEMFALDAAGEGPHLTSR